MAMPAITIAKAALRASALVRRSFTPAEWWLYQYAYGHREVLIAYAELPTNSYLKGDLQHGWSLGHHTRVQKTLTPFGREGFGWVWESEAAKLAVAAGCRRKIAIGSPWLYLLRMSGVSPAWTTQTKPRAEAHVLFVPTHHYPGIALRRVHLDSARRLLSQFAGLRVVVLLAMSDFLQEGVRRVYQDEGFVVTCAGNTGYPYRFPVAAYQDFGDRTRFLPNILELLRSTSLMVTNGMGSHVLYAGSLDVPVLVWPFTLEDQQRLPLGDGSVAGASEYRQILEYERVVLRICGDGFVNADLLLHEAASKLGADSLLPPEALRSALAWGSLKGEGPWPTLDLDGLEVSSPLS